MTRSERVACGLEGGAAAADQVSRATGQFEGTRAMVRSASEIAWRRSSPAWPTVAGPVVRQPASHEAVQAMCCPSVLAARKPSRPAPKPKIHTASISFAKVVLS